MVVACFATESAKPSPKQVAEIDIATISDEMLKSALSDVQEIYDSLGSTEKAAKGPEPLTKLKEKLQEAFRDPSQAALKR